MLGCVVHILLLSCSIAVNSRRGWSGGNRRYQFPEIVCLQFIHCYINNT